MKSVLRQIVPPNALQRSGGYILQVRHTADFMARVDKEMLLRDHWKPINMQALGL